MTFILLAITALLLKSATSQDLSSMPNIYLHDNCSGDGQFEQGSEYQTNLNHILSNLTSNSGSQNFYNLSIGESQSKVYGLYLCYYGIDNQLCKNCIQTAANQIQKSCTTNVEGIVWYFLCMLRYSNRPIFSMKDVSKYYLYEDGQAKYGQFSEQLSKTFISLFDVAASRCSSLSTAATVSFLEGDIMMNAHVECTPDLSESDCRSCLRTALTRFEIRSPQVGVLVQPSCQLSSAFVDAQSLLPPATNKKLYIGIGVASGIAAIALTFMAIKIYCLKKPKVTIMPTPLVEIESMENLHMEYDAIKDATNNFSEKNELGRGGFGIVYKGNLRGGKFVAVKKLLFASRQGVKVSDFSQQRINRQFEAEACLSAKLQHKNLVKVYGFCRKNDEKLLVYEFVANKSLDQFLYDTEKAKEHLNWETRYKIIVGVARGLFYLHEDSIPKIIHRDIKPSNILLDDKMNPKIADFGLSRLFPADKSHTNTRTPEGTIGFIAPEHLATGNISIKSDLYSYGIMLLAIVSGFRTRCSNPNAQQVNFLSFARRLWGEGKHLNLVDSTLGDNLEEDEAKRCIQVGLLCAQEDPSERPNMASVLIMLNTELNIELPEPAFPPVIPYMQETSNSLQSTETTTFHDANSEMFPH